ncbi:MAG: PD40 domain-containing protein [Kiritimatiellae bacterium]|nr:PD40 domain-containing protein [Kiritimatiellia bacterium]
MFSRLAKISRVAAVLAAALVAAPPSGAVTPFTVTKGAGSGKDQVSLASLKTGGALGATFADVLKRDLDRSGWFEVASSRYGGGIEVAGVATQQGGDTLATRVRVRWNGGSFDWGDTTSGTREARWQAHRLADEMTRRIKGRQGIAATRIALVGKEGRGGRVCICDSDGASLQRFTQEPISPLSPSFAPGGAKIYYTSFSRGYPCIFGVSTRDGRRDPLANFTGLNTGGAVSPDGKFVAAILSHSGNPELYIIDTASRKVRRLTRTPGAAEASPCWSPDGNRIAYVSDVGGSPQVYVIGHTSMNPVRVSRSGSQNVAPSWGADGRIAYASKQGSFRIVVCDPATGETKTVSPDGADWEDPSWAPDGRHIVASRRDGASYSLWILDTEGDSPVKLSLPAGDWRSPDWSGPVR